MSPADVMIQIQADEANQREAWERERLTWFYIHAHSMADRKERSPQKLHPFPWDRTATGAVATRNPKEVYDQWHRNKKQNVSGS